MQTGSVQSVAPPVLIRRENGGWLAVAAPGAPFRIGVAAWSADAARDRFDKEMREWVELAGNGEAQNSSNGDTGT
jgi:hypothetical protein